MPPFKMNLALEHERSACNLEASGNYRVLRRLPTCGEIWCRSMPCANPTDTTFVAVCDTETTGTSPEDKMIEIGIVLMAIDSHTGDLINIVPARSWLEDPGAPLSDIVADLTDLTDVDLYGQQFADDEITQVLSAVDVIIAHNAAFDAAFVSQRFPQITTPWACSMSEIDWHALGFGHRRGLEALLNAAGWFPDESHRAGPDAWSTACLLARIADDGKTLAWHLIQRAQRPTARVYATNARFSQKDALKAAGYQWDAARKVWSLEGEPERIANEATWLASLHPRLVPRIEPRTWHNRWSS